MRRLDWPHRPPAHLCPVWSLGPPEDREAQEVQVSHVSRRILYLSLDTVGKGHTEVDTTVMKTIDPVR